VRQWVCETFVHFLVCTPSIMPIHVLFVVAPSLCRTNLPQLPSVLGTFPVICFV